MPPVIDRANEAGAADPVIPAGARFVRRGAHADAAAALAEGRALGSRELLKEESGRQTISGVVSTESGDRRVIIKRIPERVGVRRWLYRLLRLSPAFRQWRGAEVLASSGIATSAPIAILRGVADGVSCEWLILDAVDGQDALHCLQDALRSSAFSEEGALATLLGGFVRVLAEAGIRNRDHKLSNLIVCADDVVAVVDTVGLARGVHAEHAMLLAMLKEAAGVGLLPRRTTLLRALIAAVDDWKPMWRRLDDDLRRAGDTTPRVNPLRSEV